MPIASTRAAHLRGHLYSKVARGIFARLICPAGKKNRKAQLRDLHGRQREIAVQVHGTLLHLNAQGCSTVGPKLAALALRPLTAAVGTHRCRGVGKDGQSDMSGKVSGL